METQVRTPQSVFMMPQRLVVPLFQRPYVWNEENQWEPLWNDVARVAERKLAKPSDKHAPHFNPRVAIARPSSVSAVMRHRPAVKFDFTAKPRNPSARPPTTSSGTRSVVVQVSLEGSRNSQRMITRCSKPVGAKTRAK